MGIDHVENASSVNFIYMEYLTFSQCYYEVGIIRIPILKNRKR